MLGKYSNGVCDSLDRKVLPWRELFLRQSIKIIGSVFILVIDSVVPSLDEYNKASYLTILVAQSD